jgi:hypothetical protein
MKTKLTPRTLAIVAGAIFTLNFSLVPTFAQGTAFTYQGRLNDGASGANGTYDVRFAIYDALTLGTPQGPILTNTATAVSNGLFTAVLDFGNQFPGAARWLELGVRTNGNGSFSTLTPRQPLTPAPYAMYAAGAATATTATSFSGGLTAAQLPVGTVAAITNGGGPYQTLARSFSGGWGGVTNLDLTKSIFGNANHLRFTDAVGSEEAWLHAAKNMNLETVNDATFWAGHNFNTTIDYDFTLHTKHDENFAVDNNLTDTIGYNYSLSVGSTLSTIVGGGMNLSVATALGITAGSFNFQANGNATTTTINNRSDTVGLNQTLSVGNNFSTTVGGGMNLSVGSNLGIFTGGGVGLGTATPVGRLHVYSTDNPTVVRIQSTGTPGFGRLEFVSNPQGDVNEWRPAYIQSTDAGGFTGGLAFCVNGAGVGNKFGSNEVMRLVNGNVGIGTTSPSQKLHVIGNILASGTITGSSDRNVKEHFSPVNPREVLEKVSGLPITEWNYQADNETLRHIGPMAQDFYSAFNVGLDDKHISMVDADGVALAAIQGLNQKLEEKDAEIETLKRNLEKLTQVVQTLIEKN